MSGERIALIGGEENAIKGLVQLLSLEGFRVETFREACGARESLSDGRLDAVIADIDPPGPIDLELDGLTSPAVPFILVTSHADALSSHRVWEMGACAILEKPLNFEDLMAILRGSPPGGPREESRSREPDEKVRDGLSYPCGTAPGWRTEGEIVMPALGGSRSGRLAGEG